MSGPTSRVRTACSERDGGMCVRCPAARTATQLHHRRPRAMGSSDRDSTNQPSNLVSLCEACHRQVESQRAQAMLDGYLVSQSNEPSSVPIKIRGRWYLLNDLGQKVPVTP